MPTDPVRTVVAGTVVDAFMQRTRMTPARAAFQVMTDNRWSPVDWATCAESVRNLAAALAASGIGPGDRVAICAGTSLSWELAQMGALYSGASVVGLDLNYPDAVLAQLLADSRAQVLIAQSAAVLARLPASARDGLKFVATIEDAPPDSSVRSLRALAQSATKIVAPARARPGDEAIVVYSSGTTGFPKAVAYRHDQLSLAVQAILDAFSDIDADSTLVCWLPLANLFQRMINFAAMVRGATSYIVEDPRTVIAHVANANPRVFIGVPRFFEKLQAGMMDRVEAGSAVAALLARTAISVGDRHAQAIRSGTRPSLVTRLLWHLADRWVLARIRATFGVNLRYFISGSAPMPRWLLEWYDAIGLPVLEAYGVSENIVPISTNRQGARRLGTVGKPMPVHEVTLADDREILVQGPGVAGATEDPRDPANRDGFLRTGDLGEFDADGFLRITGRKADVFKSSTGKWIAPADIEGRLSRLPYVEHAIVLGAERKAIVALIAVAASHLELLALPQDAPADGNDGEMENGIRNELADDIMRVLADLPSHQHPAGVLLLSGQGFSIAGGELTTNLKIRRRHIERQFAVAIERLYRAVGRAPGGLTILVAANEPSRTDDRETNAGSPILTAFRKPAGDATP